MSVTMIRVCMCVHAQSCSTLCDPMGCSMELSRQEYWSELPFPPPGDLPNPGTELVLHASPTQAGRFFTAEPPGKPVPHSKKVQHE